MLPSDWKKHERVIVSNLFPNSQIGCLETHRQESNENAEFLLPSRLLMAWRRKKPRNKRVWCWPIFLQNNPLPMRTSWWINIHFTYVWSYTVTSVCIVYHFTQGRIYPNMHLRTITAFSWKSTAGGYRGFFFTVVYCCRSLIVMCLRDDIKSYNDALFIHSKRAHPKHLNAWLHLFHFQNCLLIYYYLRIEWPCQFWKEIYWGK